jgi:hypothetical protein
MPIPGPRTQSGPDPGYRNPDGSTPTFFNHWLRPAPVRWPGRTPAMMVVTLRGCVLGAGQIRRMWRQAVDVIPAQAPFSWTQNSVGTNPHAGLDITRALRYMTRSLYVAGGTDNTRYAALHTVVRKQNAYKTVTVNQGQVRNRPTVRNRLTSFGSRVPTLNRQIQAAENQSVGAATQA